VVGGTLITPTRGELFTEGHAPTLNNPNWVIIDTTQNPNWVKIVT
jgi:hypothetical protein